MWALVDRRADMRRHGTRMQMESRQFMRQIGASFKKDRQQRATDAAAEIEGHLVNGDLQEAWRVAKG
eukprot:12109078-Ditylum_brightwellii.AAC.1